MIAELKRIPAIAVISRVDRLTIPQIPSHSGPAIHSLFDALKSLGVTPIGDLVYIYHRCDGDPTVPFDLEIAVPIPPDFRADIAPPLQIRTVSPFRCIATDYTGPMTGIGAAWMELVKYVRAAEQPTSESREIYKTWIAFDSADNITELQQGIA